MIARFPFRAALLFSSFFLPSASLFSAQKNPKDLKPVHRTSWSLEGGAFFVTEGRIPNGPCFRVDGHVDAPQFFDKLQRVDDDGGTTYRRGTETVTEFPAQLDVIMTVHDFPCSIAIGDKRFAPPLTREIMRSLRLKLYWKRGVRLLPVGKMIDPRLNIRQLEPNIKPEADDLPPRYEWLYNFTLPSEGVPIDDSLVFTFETQQGEIVARTSARL
jgi:hypothetical protein